MKRRVTPVVVLVAVTATLAAACTPPSGPAPTTWKVKPVSVKVVNPEDSDFKDEPYAIQIGFRSKVGVAGSADAFIVSQCRSHALPANDAAPAGTTVAVPPGSADIVFPNAQNLDLGDVLLNLAPFEIFGSLSFAVERDGLFPDSCAMTDALESLLVPVMKDALELLIAQSPVPPTQEQLIDLIVSNLGNFIQGLGSLIATFIEGLGNPDDIIGTAIQIHLPTKGAFSDLVNTGLAIAGLKNGELPIQGLPATMKIRIGQLLPSSASFDFSGGGYEWILNTAVGH
jgi:hypothetical protein